MDLSKSEAARLLGSRRRALAGAGQLSHTWEPLDSRAASSEAQHELVEIDAALARIEDGTYGTCEICGGAIGRDRLRALPEVRRCVSCSSRLSVR
jgi:RNA polymerase-binding transcription factor DksA